MIIFAIAIPWFTRKKPFSALGWKLSVKWIFISLGVGVLMGYRNPGGFNPKDPLAILLALFHTFSMELYFRGYLLTTFERSMKGWWVPFLLSSFLYGLLYLTSWPIWAGPPLAKMLLYLTSWPIWARPPLAKMIFVVGFTLVAMPFGYGYKKSGSFFVPWMMHFFGVLKYTMLF